MKYYFYNSYDLFIKSSIKIPELEPIYSSESPSKVEVTIKLENFSSFEKTKDIPKFRGISKIRKNAREIYIFWNDKLLFKIKNGQEIIVNSNVDINPTFLRSLILGRAMGSLLHQRGFLVLHASAVNINGHGVAFIGWRGDGKSTTTMALLNSKHSLISDDVLAIKLDDTHNTLLAVPSFPKIKLRHDISKSASKELLLSKQIHPDIKKYYYDVKRFSQTVVPLKKIYVLEKGNKNKVESLNKQEAIINLIKHSYCASILEGKDQKMNFKQCTTIMEKIPIKCLNTNHCIDQLDELVHLIEEDIKYL